jgi:hypothetical protein
MSADNLMSDAIMKTMGGGDVIALVDPSRWDFPAAPQLAYANGHADALAASTPVGGWEDMVVVGWQRRMRNTEVAADHPWSQWSTWKECSESQREECLSSGGRLSGFPELRTEVRPVYAPLPPSVSTEGEDQGSNRKGDLPTGQAEPAVVDDRLHDAIRQLRQHMTTIQAAKIASAAGHPQGMGPIWNLVNALPAIVRQLDAAELDIEAAFERYEDVTPQPAEGCSSNEGAGQ